MWLNGADFSSVGEDSRNQTKPAPLCSSRIGQSLKEAHGQAGAESQCRLIPICRDPPPRAMTRQSGILRDAFSRRIVGWSIDSTQTSQLVMNALGVATAERHPDGELVIRSDRGAQSARPMTTR